LYASNSFNNRVQIFPLDQSKTTGTTLISQIQQGFKIYVDMLAIGWRNGLKVRIEAYKLMIDVLIVQEYGLDKEKNVYMTEHNRNRVLKWSSVTNITTIVAGETDKKGPGANHLNEPQGIFVDKTTKTLYIADLVNHRIQQ